MDCVYRLGLTEGLHVGRHSVSLEGTLTYAPSDTLFASLVATWAAAQPDQVAGRLAPFEAGQPPFLLTSAFPCAGEVRLYPAPILPASLPAEEREGAGKQFKRLTHVSEGILRAWLAGDALAGQLGEARPGGNGKAIPNFVQSGRAWVTADERRQIAATLKRPADEPEALTLWREEVTPHVAVDRINNRPNLFHTGRVSFAAGCGLWFAARYADAGWQAVVEQTLALQADAGLGGLRSRGHGAFAWAPWPGTLNLPEPAPGDYALLLSRAAPTQGQMTAITDEQARYRLATVGGWCGSEEGAPRKRRRVRLLAEGSVVRWPADGLGCLVDVNPAAPWGLAHKVYRNGFAMGVRIEPRALPEVT